MTCPHGNPIPGLEELISGGVDGPVESTSPGGPAGALPTPGHGLSNATMLSALAVGADASVTVERISEQLQPDDELMRRLHDIGVLPGRTVIIRKNRDGVELGVGPGAAVVDHFTAEHVFVVPVA